MAKKKAFLLRLDPAVFDSLQRWAADDLRSANSQMEYLLRRALQTAGRLNDNPGASGGEDEAQRPQEAQGS
ncbi:MAG: hypothetical protein FI707_02670 [SAR202 cluster bacterium]|jgi:hypothetical protein|nr:hypothetical protein [Chloroflexota bacterium]MDP6422524.1 hypothetical protein [SAR202 cluster bacterium]HAL48083.1 hypothetical protein [Dehalococcoidia bacterium]MDP6665124.1 hypothetical protein [SAR202 cluster bacterium]MDP6799884.1 hypothetical protein [SAR202 cluster bacterium]|tara:strand:- start:9665 stop:9877 length:213 start_codon:yes stop_codon:yes gene_type:complete